MQHACFEALSGEDNSLAAMIPHAPAISRSQLLFLAKEPTAWGDI